MIFKGFFRILLVLVMLSLIFLPISVINPSVAFATGSVIMLDDFDQYKPDTGEWKFVNSLGDGTLTIVSAKAQLSVPAFGVPDWAFTGWSGDLTRGSNPQTLTMFTNKSVSAIFETVPTLSLPTIDIWYGTSQSFGQLGNPQKWVNILGNATDPDGIASLSYSLNGGVDQTLSIGPDDRRLLSAGDFNVEINRADLNIGSNEVSITAVDNLSNTTTQIVTANYTENSSWPLPYSINWSTVTDIQDVVQVVDGKWAIEPGGVRVQDVGYDRVLAMGDEGWTDYEVTVPITINAIDESSYGSPISVSPGIGLTLRWHGHTDDPIVCSQFHCGWEPTGGGVWYEWTQTGADNLSIFAKPPSGFARIKEALFRFMNIFVYTPYGFVRTNERQFELGNTYWFKTRVEKNVFGTLFSLKIWEDGVESEPVDWTLQRKTGIGNLKNGSFLIIAHHVDATIGNIDVLPLVVDNSPDSVIDLLSKNVLSVITWLAILLIIFFVCWFLMRYLTNQYSQKLFKED